ncbi:hypothetical protein HYW20_06725 [Candidatus Woesearchaeota archaeon]|nr:hypothetical protein [Candidatus Woesearchaeota archaeon]
MDNFEVREGSLVISVNPKIYPLDVIFSAAYLFTDKNYIVLDGNPEEEVLVEIKPKEKTDAMERIADEFNNELINYGAYAVQTSRNAHTRLHILQRVLQTAGAHHSHPETSLKESKPWKEDKKDETSDS